MSDRIQFTGQISIMPPLNAGLLASLNQYVQEVHPAKLEPEAPGEYCPYAPTAEGASLVVVPEIGYVDHVAWLRYLIQLYFKPSGRVLNGVLLAWGEQIGDAWRLHVHDNAVSRKEINLRKGITDG